MPIALTVAEREVLRRHALKIRVLVDFHLDSGRYCFWDGEGIGQFDGGEYLPASDFGVISSISLGQDLGAEGMEISVSGVKLLELAPDVEDPAAFLATIEDENYIMRRVDVRFAFFDAETDALVLLVQRYAGLIDQIRHVEQVDEETGAAAALMVISLESIARRYGRRLGRTRSHDDQQEIWPGDTFFKYTASSVSKQGTLLWGRKPAGGTTVSSGGGDNGSRYKNKNTDFV